MFQKKKVNKLTIFLLQALALGFVFVFFFSRDAIFIFKGFLDKIPLDESVEIVIYRGLLPFKFLVHSPSLCAVLFLLMNIICYTYNRNLMIKFGYEPFVCEEQDVDLPKVVAREKTTFNNIEYLKTMRLLF